MQLALYGAGDGIRTRDPNLGKVVLYQLSYSRNGHLMISSLYTLKIAEPISLEFYHKAENCQVIK